MQRKIVPFIFSEQDGGKKRRGKKEIKPEPENSWKNTFNRKDIRENTDFSEKNKKR